MNSRLALLCLSLLFSSPLFARDNNDILVMKNGDRLTCEIKGLSAGVLSVKLGYAQGTVGIQWSKVARLESNQLFLVQTTGGTVYTSTLSVLETPGEQAVQLHVISTPEATVEISQSQIVRLDETVEGFRKRFNGVINTGLLYSKGNESTQYSISSQVEYRRERWSGQANFNSSFASSSGSHVSTRNQTDLSGMRLRPGTNWFYSGTGSFLQSSVQGLALQTTLGGGIGRYLRNSNQSSFYVLGGFAWQNAQYKTTTVRQQAQNTAAALLSSELKIFRFKQTDLDISALVLPELTEPGRIRATMNGAYYVKLFSDLSWNLSVYGNWDNQPPPTFSGSDYGTSSGLSWTFGNR